jgi:hypothetical protein
MRRTAGYTLLDRKKSEDILQELKVDPIMDFVQEYRKSWKEHVIRMNNNRLPKNVRVCSLWPKKCGKTNTKRDWDSNRPVRTNTGLEKEEDYK